jgi:hypothetical protein
MANSWFNIPTTSANPFEEMPSIGIPEISPTAIPTVAESEGVSPGTPAIVNKTDAITGPSLNASAVGGKPAPSDTVGVITASQSAITFAGAPAAVTLVWKVIEQVFPSVGDSKVFPVTLALVIGLLIWWQTEPSGAQIKERVSGFLYALINSFAIAAATLGITAAIK